MSPEIAPLSPAEVLSLLPQRPPFRFVDVVDEIDAERIVARYRFRRDEFFYAGHFPGRPVTPGVILIETMAQVGVVALGYYLASLAMPRAELGNYVALFSECEAEFSAPVYPGEEVTIRAERVYWRSRKLKSRASLHLADGRVAALATVAGVGVPNGAL